MSKDEDTIEIKVTKIYEQLVSTINYDIIKNATNGYILTERNLENYVKLLDSLTQKILKPSKI